MINKNTSKVLGLKPLSRAMCHSFYLKTTSELQTPEAIKEAISWWQEDTEQLHMLWWVLNYYSDTIDPDRSLRALIEKTLNLLASKKQASS